MKREYTIETVNDSVDKSSEIKTRTESLHDKIWCFQVKRLPLVTDKW